MKDLNKNKIIIKNAYENNLKNINLELPKNKMIVFTGLSGSGKSTLAMDTIYAEGQRRYMESLSSYARQFLGQMEKPNVESIEGLSPAIAIDQKTTSKNPRSTVGTVTEIYDYFRLLFARIGKPYCKKHNTPILSLTVDEIRKVIRNDYSNHRVMITSPIISDKKGSHKNLIDDLRLDGFTRILLNDKLYELDEEIAINKNNRHSIEVVIDRLKIKDDFESRLYDAIESGLKISKGKIIVKSLDDNSRNEYSNQNVCSKCGFSVPDLEPRLFSFNAPLGSCPDCDGIGTRLEIDIDLLIPDKKRTLNEGIIDTNVPGFGGYIYLTQIQTIAKKYKIDLNKPFNELSLEHQNIILYGSDDILEFEYFSAKGTKTKVNEVFEGLASIIMRRYKDTSSSSARETYEGYMSKQHCPTCKGRRLNDFVLAVKIDKMDIYQVTSMSVENINSFIRELEQKISVHDFDIAKLIINEISDRTQFLIDIGLGYLTLTRSAYTLSGGESQRIRLATQIGSKLTGVLYVLDEPSIGLHQKDNAKLIKTMKQMRDLGNTLIIVEHDTDTMLESDYLVDIGPGAGENGGQVVSAGTPKQVMKSNSLTGRFLRGVEKIEIPKARRKGNGKEIKIVNASQNNLKKINVTIPLNKLVAVTGVSGSGKSTLIREILMKGISKKLHHSREKAGKHDEIIGLENIDKIIKIDQSPIGRTPRSNPATYTGVFTDIRELFAASPDAQIRGYDKGRFSFNVKGGRCENCSGDGIIKIEMHFLPDVYVPCEICEGKKYNDETLKIRYRGKNINDVLEMTIEEAHEFFTNIPSIRTKLQSLVDVGLGYIRLGQSSTTLSGGEAQRVKLASELYKRSTGKTIYILDEPTTGLHFEDVRKLIKVLERITNDGNTVIVIEHNLDVIKVSDHIIDLGPDGGDKGGYIVCEGTPEEVANVESSYTGIFLKQMLDK
jgi:excinuclease ABC subunit A